MRTITTKAARIAAVAALGVGMGGGAAALAAAGGGEGTPPPWAPQRTDAPVPATAAQKAAFGILGASVPQSADPDRAALRTLARRARIGLDADGARVVGATERGPVWLAPAGGGLCLALEDDGDGSVGVACERDADAVTRGTTVGDGTRIYGVVPDGVEAVTVTPEAGDPRAVAVSPRGFYTLPSQDATITLDGPGGRVSFAVAG